MTPTYPTCFKYHRRSPPKHQAPTPNHERQLRTLRTEPVAHPDQGHQQAQARLHSARQPSHDGESHVVHDQHLWRPGAGQADLLRDRVQVGPERLLALPYPPVQREPGRGDDQARGRPLQLGRKRAGGEVAGAGAVSAFSFFLPACFLSIPCLLHTRSNKNNTLLHTLPNCFNAPNQK